MSAPPADRLAIAVTERSDEPPAISYFAEVLATDPRLDLAVVRIVADVRGRPVRGQLFPSVPLGDSDKLDLGDRLAIFGYPGIGGDTVTYTSGNVSGFTAESGVRSHRAWIKTDATIAGGNSGGTAVDEAGRLVGIPTQAAAGTGVTPVDARPVLDTNRDGVVDNRDTPMAVGGFINGLRPVNLARPLLEQAGVRAQTADGGDRPSIFEPKSTRPAAPSRPAQFRDLLFSTTVTDDGRPIGASDKIPSGVATVYATFEYDGLVNGTPWSVVWMSNGQQIISQEDTWDDGPQGRKAVKVSNKKGLPPGEYHLVLGIGGRVALEGKVMVGNPVDESDSEVSGRIVDVQSQQPVAGATIMVLKPDAPLRDFLRTHDQSALFTSAETDSAGRFKLPKAIAERPGLQSGCGGARISANLHRSGSAGIDRGARAGGHRRSRIAARILTPFHWPKRPAPSGKVHKTWLITNGANPNNRRRAGVEFLGCGCSWDLLP